MDELWMWAHGIAANGRGGRSSERLQFAASHVESDSSVASNSLAVCPDPSRCPVGSSTEFVVALEVTRQLYRRRAMTNAAGVPGCRCGDVAGTATWRWDRIRRLLVRVVACRSCPAGAQPTDERVAPIRPDTVA